LRTIFSEAWRTRVAEPVLHHHVEHQPGQHVEPQAAQPQEAAGAAGTDVPSPRDEPSLSGTNPMPILAADAE
jgi:hypothetical protein